MTTASHTSPRNLRFAIAAMCAGAIAGPLFLVLLAAWTPEVVLEMDREVPGALRGVHDSERNGDETFAWTTARASVRMGGLDRRIAWQCVVRLRAPRPAGVAAPNVELGADGVTLARVIATDRYQDANIEVPPRDARSGLQLTIASSNTFVPGPEDTRALALQVDRIACEPADGWTLAARGALVAAAIGAALFGTAFGLLAPTLSIALGATLLLAATQALPLSTGTALFTDFHARVPTLAMWIVLPVMFGFLAIERRQRQPFEGAVRFTVAYTIAVLYLLLLTLLHPAKALVDAVFHAHRLEWVLAGRYYFTQPMPGGVAFPYAIALYVVAAPFAALVHDHVALLRIVVAAWQVAAGALLYPMVVHSTGDRLAGALAVVLYSLVPLGFIVVGNANLTNAFGQSAALVTMAAATLWTLGPRHIGQFLGLFLLASLAFLAHVSTFPLLLVALLSCAALNFWLGGPALRAPARSIALATIAAAIFSVIVYYGQFSEVYATLDRVRAGSATAPAQPGAAAPAAAPAELGATPPLASRAATAVALSVRAVGWPIALLALPGAWRLAATGIRHRLGFAILAWGIVYVAFLVFGVLAPVGQQHYRYLVEFIDRVNYATFPAAVVLAALGAARAWRAGWRLRIAAAALVLAAMTIGVQHWLAWVRW